MYNVRNVMPLHIVIFLVLLLAVHQKKVIMRAKMIIPLLPMIALLVMGHIVN